MVPTIHNHTLVAPLLWCITVKEQRTGEKMGENVTIIKMVYKMVLTDVDVQQHRLYARAAS